MSKEESIQIRGIAFLFMLCFHMFGSPEYASAYANHLFYNGYPLSFILSGPLTNPVPFFIFLSGYGLYFIHKNGKKDVHRFTRLLDIFVFLWITLLIFVGIGHFIEPNAYPGSLGLFLKNCTSIWHSYNGTYWFLPPYIFLSLCAPMFFYVLDKFGSKYIFAIIFILDLAASVMVEYYSEGLPVPIFKLLNRFDLFFMFMCGAMASREDWVEKARKMKGSSWILPILCLVIVAFVRVKFVRLNVYNAFYTIVFILCFCCYRIPKILQGPLSYIGNRALGLWLVHYWFLLFWRDYFVVLRSPIVALIALLLISLCATNSINYFIKVARLRH